MNFNNNSVDLYTLHHTYKCYLAHAQAHMGWITEDPLILCLEDQDGRTVAYIQVQNDWTTENPIILTLEDSKYAESIAELQIEHGWTTNDPMLLNVEVLSGDTITNLQIKNGWTPPEELMDINIGSEDTIRDLYTNHKLEKL